MTTEAREAALLCELEHCLRRANQILNAVSITDEKWVEMVLTLQQQVERGGRAAG